MSSIGIGTECLILNNSDYVEACVEDIRIKPNETEKLEFKVSYKRKEPSSDIDDWISDTDVYFKDLRTIKKVKKLSDEQKNQFRHIIRERYKIHFGTVILKPDNVEINDKHFINNEQFMCPVCLSSESKQSRLDSEHIEQCCPPGIVIYNSGGLAVYEVDGALQSTYCSNLWKLSECFLSCKGHLANMETNNRLPKWLFYVLYKKLGDCQQYAGYFSKAKDNSKDVNNINCFVILPNNRSKGFGQFLIELSYELVRRQNAFGTPEKPLTDFGNRSFLLCWKFQLKLAIKRCTETELLTLNELREVTRMSTEDMINTLCQMNLLYAFKGKIYVKVESKQIEQYTLDIANNTSLFDPSDLNWTPSLYF
jgi:hypothetical protein